MSDYSESCSNPLRLFTEVTGMLARLCLEAHSAHSELLILAMSLSTLHSLPVTDSISLHEMETAWHWLFFWLNPYNACFWFHKGNQRWFNFLFRWVQSTCFRILHKKEFNLCLLSFIQVILIPKGLKKSQLAHWKQMKDVSPLIWKQHQRGHIHCDRAFGHYPCPRDFAEKFKS